jgi:hypothetical protein
MKIMSFREAVEATGRTGVESDHPELSPTVYLSIWAPGGRNGMVVANWMWYNNPCAAGYARDLCPVPPMDGGTAETWKMGAGFVIILSLPRILTP